MLVGQYGLSGVESQSFHRIVVDERGGQLLSVQLGEFLAEQDTERLDRLITHRRLSTTCGNECAA